MKSRAVVAVVVAIMAFAAVLTRPPSSAHAYAYSGCRDLDGRIGYQFKNGTPDIEGTGEQQAVFTAMRLWEKVSNVEFGPPIGTAETLISWEMGEHGDSKPFDGPNGVKAHAFNFCGSLPGDLHFDDAEAWVNGPGGLEQPSDLVAIGAHELGHVLGFEHSTDPTAMMAEGQYFRRSLSWDDIFGVQVIYGRSYSVYHLKNSLAEGNPSNSFEYGSFGQKPVAGDWNKDGIDTIGVWNSSGGIFTLNDGNPGGAVHEFGYGKTGDRPLAGDWNGDGMTTVGIFRPSNTIFYLEDTHTSSSSEWSFAFGEAQDLPLGGDWNGDGFDSIGVYRPSTSTFLLRNQKSAGVPDVTVSFGANGDLPIVGDWDNDGDDTIGVYRPSQGVFYLRNSNSAGPADVTLVFGRSYLGQVVTPAVPVAGDWDGNGSVEYGLYQN